MVQITFEQELVDGRRNRNTRDHLMTIDYKVQVTVDR